MIRLRKGNSEVVKVLVLRVPNNLEERLGIKENVLAYALWYHPFFGYPIVTTVVKYENAVFLDTFEPRNATVFLELKN